MGEKAATSLSVVFCLKYWVAASLWPLIILIASEMVISLTASKSSLDKFSATKYYGDIISTYNGFPTTINKLNPDLPSYVVGKAVDALFDQVAQEEANIRANAAARTTDILKRVFGWAAKA